MQRNPLEPTALLITKTEAATRLGVGIATINNLIRQGLLDAVRLGYRTVRVRASSVEDLPARLDTTHRPQTPAGGPQRSRSTNRTARRPGSAAPEPEEDEH